MTASKTLTFRSNTNQKEQMLQYLRDFGSITGKEASDMLCITNYKGRIHELRKEGYNITDEWETGVNRFGIAYRYKRYKLEE